MSALDRQRTAHLAAMAILVADGVIDRREGIEALMDHHERQEARQRRPTAARGEESARSLARVVDHGGMSYGEAEHTVALVLTGGGYSRYEAAAQAAGRLLAHALTRRDDLRHGTAEALQRAISDPLSGVPKADPSPTATAILSTPSERPRPVLRQPGRG